MEKLLAAINAVRALDPDMPAQVLATLLYVASHDNCHKQAVEEDLGLTPASGSRNTDWLGALNRHKRPGLRLINKTADPANKRRIQLSLTNEGALLINTLRFLLYG
jgi:DNA-binding MarR family transcriptional regulator